MIRRVARKLRNGWHHFMGPKPALRLQIKCPSERLGTDYGGWVFSPRGLNEKSVVYSFGIGEDLSFDLALIEKYKVRVHAFDPTPRSLNWIRSQNLPKHLEVHEYGLAAKDGSLNLFAPADPAHVSYSVSRHAAQQTEIFSVPVKKLETILHSLGHREIDLLKMDIEGSEYEVIDDILKSGISVKQILVEFHHRFEGVGMGATEKAVRALNRAGYRIFSISPSGEEVSFLRMTNWLETIYLGLLHRFN